ncbi:nucleotide-binding protein [Cupriavidus sp. BIS7]|uniref:TIR domain-containing protein n=1 Tax=Cupriavidus sp. BIS7 TaxID=1217718 RepID=UPI00035E8FFF|nr:nucleotide-binding protein [Cupriavidus sp. BIS7]
MAIRKARSPEPRAELRLKKTLTEARSLVDAQIAKGEALLKEQVANQDTYEDLQRRYYSWSSYCTDLLKTIATTNELSEEFSFWGISGVSIDATLGELVNDLRRDIKTAVDRLGSIKERLELFPSDVSESARDTDTRRAVPDMKNVFIVHGHDEAAKQSVARVLQTLGLNPVILHEQANQGRTIFEKLEDTASQAGFAVVLMTGDDVGKAKTEEELKPRARQNVILELGYFAGLLKRSRVCALYKDNVEIPSDILSIGYVKLDDAGHWKFELARELKAAGYTVDVNTLL